MAENEVINPVETPVEGDAAEIALPSHQPESGIISHVTEQATNKTRVAVVLVFDTALFTFWIGVAYITKNIAGLAESEGVHEIFAVVFHWASSGTTLLLALGYVASDVRQEWRRAFRSTPSGTKK